VEDELSRRWGIQVQFKRDKPTAWLLNTSYEFESVIPGQVPAMTEEMRAHLATEQPPKVLNIMLIVVINNTYRYQKNV
jgi:hypothetical protein